MKESHFVGDFDAIFGDFFGWDWGTPAILRQNPKKITVFYGCGCGIGSDPRPPR